MRASCTYMRRALLVASATVLALSVPGAARASGGSSDAGTKAAAPSGNITIDVLTVNGSGCPAGTASVSSSSDNTSFRVFYRSYEAEIGPSAEATDLRKNCQLSLLVHVPQGFTYAIARADYFGTAHLASGASGLERANYYFQGSSEDNFADHTFQGAFDGRWQTTDVTDAAALVYAPCGVDRILNVNSELRVIEGSSDANKTTSYMAMKTSSGSVNTIYQFSWKSC